MNLPTWNLEAVFEVVFDGECIWDGSTKRPDIVVEIDCDNQSEKSWFGTRFQDER